MVKIPLKLQLVPFLSLLLCLIASVGAAQELGPDPATLLSDEERLARDSVLFTRVEDPHAELNTELQNKRLEIEGLFNTLQGSALGKRSWARVYNRMVKKFQRMSEELSPEQNALLLTYEQAVRAKEDGLARRTKKKLLRLRKNMQRDYNKILKALKRIQKQIMRASH